MMKSFTALMLFMAALSSCRNERVTEIKNSKGIVVQRITIQGDTSKERNGIYEKFDDQGRPVEYAVYKDGKLQGEKKIYEEGRLYSIEHHQEDQYEGPYKVYYPDGTLQLETQYVNNEITGELRGYYPSGKIREIVQMSANQENGPFTEYFENGNKKAEGQYKNGAKEEGLLMMYDSTGTLIRKMECTDGICHTIWSLKQEEQQKN